jgi:Na+/proline symporter
VLIESGTGGMIDTDVAIVALTIMFVTYGAAGGLAAAIVTDYAQGLLTILFSFMLLPFIFSAVGGMSGIRESVADPTMLSLVAPGKVTAFFIIMMSIQALVGIVAQPFIMGVCAAGKTEWEGRVGIVAGNIIKRLCTAAWTLTAIAAVAWYTQQGVDLSTIDPDFVYGNVAQAFLPKMLPGLLGVFLAALLAGVMSSCDSFMISSSGLFTENIYKRRFPDRSQTHYVWVGRGVAILVVAGGVAFAFWVPSVVKALEIWFMIAPMMGLVFWIGLFWRRMSVAGAWATTLSGFAAWWLTTQSWLINWVAGLSQADCLRLIWIERGEPTIYVPWQILGYMTIASVTGIIVSMFTKPVARSKLDRFYGLTRTPVQPGEEIDRPCALPPGATPAARRMITTAFGLEIPLPSRTSIIGFVAAWGAVAILISGFVAFVWW